VVGLDGHTALITFGQRSVASLSQDTQLIDRIGRVTVHPPAGLRAYPARLVGVAAAALHALVHDQVLLNLLALAVVLAVLGPAIIAAALALIASFAALTLSPVPMLRGFGLWCAADLAFATVAVLLVLPSLTPRVAR
jgi:predicted exporter